MVARLTELGLPLTEADVLAHLSAHPAIVTVNAIPSFTLPPYSTWSISADGNFLPLTLHVAPSGAEPDFLVTVLWASNQAPIA